jgi:hypothetical protein
MTFNGFAEPVAIPSSVVTLIADLKRPPIFRPGIAVIKSWVTWGTCMKRKVENLYAAFL